MAGTPPRAGTPGAGKPRARELQINSTTTVKASLQQMITIIYYMNLDGLEALGPGP